MASAPPAENGRLLTFRIGDAHFALPAGAVREIVRRPRVTRVPHAPAALLGIANLRGRVVPLVALGALIGKPVTAAGRVIVLEQADPVGMLVDEVSALVTEDSAEAAEAGLIDLPEVIGRAFGGVRPSAPSLRVGLVTSLHQAVEERDKVVLLAFRVSGQEYALPLEQIEEVSRRPDDIFLLPSADPVVLGTIARNGVLVPLLSARRLLGLGEVERGGQPRLVIVRIGAHRVGLLVDSVSTILRVDEGLIDPIPAVLSRGGTEARIQAICRLDGGQRLVSILASDQLVRDDLTRHIHKAQGEGETMGIDAAEAETEQFLVFRIGEQAFGLPIGVVTEVTMLPDRLTRLPKAPDFVEGVMNLRGQAIPLIDQRRRFLGDAASGKRRRVVIVSIGEVQAGFVVESVSEVLHIPINALRPAPELGGESTRIFDRVADVGGEELILIVEPGELLDRAERDLLAAMGGEAGAAS